MLSVLIGDYKRAVDGAVFDAWRVAIKRRMGFSLQASKCNCGGGKRQ